MRSPPLIGSIPLPAERRLWTAKTTSPHISPGISVCMHSLPYIERVLGLLWICTEKSIPNTSSVKYMPYQIAALEAK